MYGVSYGIVAVAVASEWHSTSRVRSNDGDGVVHADSHGLIIMD